MVKYHRSGEIKIFSRERNRITELFGNIFLNKIRCFPITYISGTKNVRIFSWERMNLLSLIIGSVIMNINNPIVKPDEGKLREYHSAEFILRHPKILYQFKIRKSNLEPMFAVVKEGSKALDSLREGDIVSMRYHCMDKSIPSESKDTKIKYIAKDSTIGFKDHYVVALDIHEKNKGIHQGNNLIVA